MGIKWASHFQNSCDFSEKLSLRCAQDTLTKRKTLGDVSGDDFSSRLKGVPLGVH